MTLRHRIRFYQQLAVLARAGVPTRTSMTRLRDRISGREIKILEQRTGAGEKVSDAFVHAGFSPFECHLVSAGERGARLEIIYQHLADFWDRQRQMMQALVGQLYYPVAALHFAIITGAVIQWATGSLASVIVSLIEGFGILYGVGISLIILVRYSWPSDLAQRFWLHVPVIGNALVAAYCYRWITALRIEYSSGIPLPEAVGDAWRASGFVGSERLAREGEIALRRGSELSPLVQQWRVLPRDWIDFIETGEISGALETALESLDAEAARAWNAAQQRMTEWVPKVLSFVVLLITGAYIMSILYQLTVAPLSEVTKALDGLGN